MAQKINSLQMTEGKSWSGLTTDNHLGALFNEAPQVASTIMSRLYGMYNSTGLDTLFSMMGAEQELDTDADFTWSLKGDDEKAVMIVGYSSTNTLKPGVAGTIFKLELEERFEFTDKLIFDDRRFSVRVMSEPYPSGTNWVHEVQIMNPDKALFIPISLLTAGRQVSKEYSPQEKTLSKTGGTVSYASPFVMKNSFSTLRMRDTVPANMRNRPMVIELMDPKSNKTTTVWTQYAEWVFYCQWMRQKNKNLMYAEPNVTAQGTYLMKGASGFPVVEGAGIRAQIAPSHQFYYTDFTIDWLEDVLLQLSVNILPEDSRHFVALTSEWGMVQFHRALENHVARFQPLDSKRVFGSGQNLGFQGQYREYIGPQGIRFTMVVLPEYQDVVSNRLMHPNGGPVEGYRYTIINFGTTKGKSNIRKVVPRGEREKMWHIAGSTSPLGPLTSFKSGSASAVDGYELHAQCKQGVIIENPLSCAELIYSYRGL
jgi:hypothetical protein